VWCRESLVAIRTTNAPYSHIPHLRNPSKEFLVLSRSAHETGACATQHSGQHSEPPTPKGAFTAGELELRSEESAFLLPIVHWRKSSMRGGQQTGSQTSRRGRCNHLQRVRTSSLVQNIASSETTMARLRAQQRDEKKIGIACHSAPIVPGWCSDLLSTREPAKAKRLGSIWLASRLSRIQEGKTI